MQPLANPFANPSMNQILRYFIIHHGQTQRCTFASLLTRTGPSVSIANFLVSLYFLALSFTLVSNLSFSFLMHIYIYIYIYFFFHQLSRDWLFCSCVFWYARRRAKLHLCREDGGLHARRLSRCFVRMEQACTTCKRCREHVKLPPPRSNRAEPILRIKPSHERFLRIIYARCQSRWMFVNAGHAELFAATTATMNSDWNGWRQRCGRSSDSSNAHVDVQGGN